MNLHGLGFLAASGLCGVLPLGGEYCERISLARQAVSSDAKAAAVAIKALRAKGAPGLDALLEECDKASDKAPYKEAIDKVAGQKDAAYSRLFWHTDFEEAKKRAQAQGKPILSLRLLGNLDEELSCANSRFFRTALYPDPEISKLLREDYVLHWQSMRPAPKVTVDFGDGRKLVRTITGNSIHYILTSDGAALDAIPGLYSPKEFLRILRAAKGQTSATQIEHLQEQLREVEEAWRKDLATIGVQTPSNYPLPKPGSASHGTPDARAAAPRAIGKAAFEMPMLNAISPAKIDESPKNATEDRWLRIAALHASDAKLSAPSIELARRKLPAEFASNQAVAKGREEDPALRTMRNFEQSMALDTVKNQYLFRSEILRWILQCPEPPIEFHNQRVYGELFLTPSSDPWLGLLPADTYSALDRGGIVECR